LNLEKDIIMKTKLASLLAASCFALAFVGGPAQADADDDKWIAKCVKDNKGEGAQESVVVKYCTCMNEKMDNKETASVTQWEKTHKKEMDACSKESGWK
jgi:hypothetical protein